jgi:uncharacterized protein YpiB (UPF0302 family)
MADDQHTIEIKLHGNLLQINAALDGNDRRRFLLLAKRRRDLNTKLARIVAIPKPAEV